MWKLIMLLVIACSTVLLILYRLYLAWTINKIKKGDLSRSLAKKVEKFEEKQTKLNVFILLITNILVLLSLIFMWSSLLNLLNTQKETQQNVQQLDEKVTELSRTQEQLGNQLSFNEYPQDGLKVIDNIDFKAAIDKKNPDAIKESSLKLAVALAPYFGGTLPIVTIDAVEAELFIVLDVTQQQFRKDLFETNLKDLVKNLEGTPLKKITVENILMAETSQYGRKNLKEGFEKK